jgi:hypothetical protein
VESEARKFNGLLWPGFGADFARLRVLVFDDPKRTNSLRRLSFRRRFRMESSRFIPPEGSGSNAEQNCPECGQRFERLQVEGESEEVCETCYQAQFEPLHLPKWQRLAKQPRAARPQGSSSAGRRGRQASAA